jgi:RHH-type transcriptional regulator, proline utilization regulon repressor / proline dehydrogenase / delta 1-pyrroline-5-carboxylate dehydrogenase
MQFGVWHNTALPATGQPPSGKAAALLDQLVARLPAAAARLCAAAASDACWQAREFDIEHDPTGLRCEANRFRYRRFARGLLRAGETLDDTGLARLLLAAAATGTPVGISLAAPRPWLDGIGFSVTVESADALAARLPALAPSTGLLRAPDACGVLKAAAVAAGMRIADAPPIDNARIEWPAWLREQAASETLHRYGNLVPKPGEISPDP